MEKFLRPERLDTTPNSPTASKEWRHWFRTINTFLTSISALEPDKLATLCNFVPPSVYEYIADCVSYDAAILVLHDLYKKPKNEVFARHLLATRRQHSGESLDEYLQELRHLSKDCNFKAVSAEANRDEYNRDAFINGLLSPMIRQRLLENKTLDLATAFDQARVLDLAQRNSESYLRSQAPMNAAAVTSPEKIDSDDSPLSAATQQPNCYFCGGARHNLPQCPERDSTCHKCNKKGHFAKVCRSSRYSPATSSSTCAVLHSPTLAAISAISPVCLARSTATAIVDTGSSKSFVSNRYIQQKSLKCHPGSGHVSMTSSSLSLPVLGHCTVHITLKGNSIQILD
ncbi:uncharacterized protein LOC121876105 [Homarus americanus]|uniref:uncharacterized protein LOC121876105 n=1 Tax=Homarus americanus TaxID=6706 RepID=UPI001C471804|nr:uncharacterized protein LOC121876105 [Homarus americanus]